MRALLGKLSRLMGRPSGPVRQSRQAEAQAIAQLVAEVRAENLTYCGRPKLENLVLSAFRVCDEKVPGVFLEAGVALGGSAIVLAHIKDRDRPLELYDVFEMIPPPGTQDGDDAHLRYADIASGSSKGLGSDQYYGYLPDLIDQVKENLRRFGRPVEQHQIKLVQGLFEDTLSPGPVALAHIDCDWYDSVKLCIDRIWPRLSPRGVMVFDDYSSYSGCRKAVDEWLATKPEIETIFSDRSIGFRRL
jgi:Macrocin-O-methyltransferase (TylF)